MYSMTNTVFAPSYIQKLFKSESNDPSPIQIPLETFIEHIMARTRISTNTIVTAFMYLDRLKRKHPRCKGSPGSGHRLVLSAIMLAAKYMYDDTFDNVAWATVSSGLFHLSHVNHMEMELLHFLNFELFIHIDDWYCFYANLERRIRPVQAPIPCGNPAGWPLFS